MATLLPIPFRLSIDTEEDLHLVREVFEYRMKDCAATIEKLNEEIEKIKSIADACQKKLKEIDAPDSSINIEVAGKTENTTQGQEHKNPETTSNEIKKTYLKNPSPQLALELEDAYN